MGFKVEEKFRIILVMQEVNLTNVRGFAKAGLLSTKVSV